MAQRLADDVQRASDRAVQTITVGHLGFRASIQLGS